MMLLVSLCTGPGTSVSPWYIVMVPSGERTCLLKGKVLALNDHTYYLSRKLQNVFLGIKAICMHFIIDHEAGEIIHLVAFACLLPLSCMNSVSDLCVFVSNLGNWFSITIKLQFMRQWLFERGACMDTGSYLPILYLLLTSSLWKCIRWWSTTVMYD